MQSIINIFILILFISCTKENAEYLGYITGTAIVQKLSGESIKINGDIYYKTVSCHQIEYYNKSKEEIFPVNCIIQNSISYITFHATYNTIYYFLKE